MLVGKSLSERKALTDQQGLKLNKGHQIRSVYDKPVGEYAMNTVTRGKSYCWSEVYLHPKQWWLHCSAKNYIQSMMILAMAMGHTVGRPVMGMGGGTINPMEQSYQLPSDCLVERKVNTTKSALSGIVRILSVFIWFDHLEENYEHQKNYV